MPPMATVALVAGSDFSPAVPLAITASVTVHRDRPVFGSRAAIGVSAWRDEGQPELDAAAERIAQVIGSAVALISAPLGAPVWSRLGRSLGCAWLDRGLRVADR